MGNFTPLTQPAAYSQANSERWASQTATLGPCQQVGVTDVLQLGVPS
ncbi:hypothetical protein DUNSADRAFT_18265 [Dunaliella salina]|uniref:Uncharacterized protein n=1 Tax=Dunaliella salina TaxID=3046 RepID=A0ABQ7G0E4_DUNSA|nr:hypothetical protein DUNSADRAFT_18265 [Dunaliella salina]|eukprot:KAF5828076.1 hypothetical protein DUNSADRAFT_18265 [Dunaliella salina]